MWQCIQHIYETPEILRSIFSTDSCLQSDNGVSTSNTRYNTYQGYIFTSHLLSSAFISLSFLLIVVTQILCHIYSRLSSRLPTLRFVPFFFIAGKLQPSLPGSSTRVELRLRALGALSSSVYPFLFLRIDSKSHRGAIRTQGPTLAASEGNRTTGATYAPGLCIRM